jgi:hypothetical protein
MDLPMVPRPEPAAPLDALALFPSSYCAYGSSSLRKGS